MAGDQFDTYRQPPRGCVWLCETNRRNAIHLTPYSTTNCGINGSLRVLSSANLCRLFLLVKLAIRLSESEECDGNPQIAETTW
jgi:hypothetical protein